MAANSSAWTDSRQGKLSDHGCGRSMRSRRSKSIHTPSDTARAATPWWNRCLSLQWFVKVDPLVGPSIEAVRDGRTRFVPKRWENNYFYWMENLRDWCVSRQLWWGHRIPAWYCQDCDETIVSMEDAVRHARAVDRRGWFRTRMSSTHGSRRRCGPSARWDGPRRRMILPSSTPRPHL